MIITLSPAKILDFQSEVNYSLFSEPLFQKEARELNSILQKKSIEDIISLMKITPSLAEDTYDYIHQFEIQESLQKQAVFTYNGIAYQGLDAGSLTEQELCFAQNHLIILSGLYGLLRPLDTIKPYRLEMQTKLQNVRGKDLYVFWRDLLSNQFARIMKEDDNIWINLASNEYSKVIDRKLLAKGSKIITPVFKERDGDVYKQVTVYAKKARGMMARFIIQNSIKNIEYIKAFDTEGYAYSEQLSNTNEWVFIR